MDENKTQNPQDEQEVKHVRRVRYKGTHPKKYKEKYKELDPTKYASDVAGIIQKGKTPAGMHISICVNEILEILQIQPNEIGLDCTLGYGGHTLKMLECLGEDGHLYATDVDPIESEKTKKRLAEKGYGEDKLTIKLRNFAQIDEFIKEGVKFDFVLADLGVSSMQIDNPERGFTFKQDGPLDLRLNPQKGISAAQRLAKIRQPELEGMLIENADEPYAVQISNGIIKHLRTGGKIETTKELAQVIENSLSFLPQKGKKEAVKKSCQRCFQAIRIDINKEYEVLYELMDKLPSVLNEGARVAILTFHSGEDRIVKKAFKQGNREGVYSTVARDVIRASKEECYINSRATCAKLRWAKV